MTEWTVVGVLVTLVGLGVAVIKPLIDLNSVIVRLTEVVKTLECNMALLTDKNTTAHGKIWEHIGEQDEQLHDHETRLTVIERTGRK